MRRADALVVDTQHSVDHDHLSYDLQLSPRSSIYSSGSVHDFKCTQDVPLQHPPVPATPVPTSPPPAPSIRLLFSFLSRRHCICLLLPAIFSSVIAGGLAPLMTYVFGQAFEAFSKFPVDPNPPQDVRKALLHSVGLSSLQLLGLAVGSIVLGSVTSALWIWTGERNAMALRKAIYLSMSKKEMSWFDIHLGEEDAGGLMAKFSRETDDVRMASSLAPGYLIQYLSTTLACLLLAFTRAWSLTLVILSAVPVLVLIQIFSQSIASPLLFRERSEIASTATLVNRALVAITTVKAFNAQVFELTRAKNAFKSLKLAARRLNRVWGVTSGLSQFVMMAMFVQGFWFGSKLVRDGKVSPGNVMVTFWACLIATSNLQMCIPQFIVLVKGKFAMAALMDIIHDSSTSSIPTTSILPSPVRGFNDPSTPKSRNSAHLQKITPLRCYGELSLHDVSFSYPSKPSIEVLSHVSIYLPANETTFIVGSSGSGKSTIAALLTRMYDPTSGIINLDDQDVRFLDPSWVRGHIAAVSQGFGGVVIFDGKTLWENVAVGVFGRPDGHLLTQVRDYEVEEACRMAMVHEFVKDLPDGYDTVLGSSSAATGVGLSGGQRQRLALARARVRDPTVLILDEATSALDATSRILVFEAIKHWRKNKTTIVITHDLSQIQSTDFVYVLKNGRVVEQGYRADLEQTAPIRSSTSTSITSGVDGEGEFRKMMEFQHAMGGLPEKDDNAVVPDAELEDDVALHMDSDHPSGKEITDKHTASNIHPLTFGDWMLDVVADLTAQPSSATPVTPKDAVLASHPNHPLNRFVPFPVTTTDEEDEEVDEGILYPPRVHRPSSTFILPMTPRTADDSMSKRLSLQFSPTSTVFSPSCHVIGHKDVQNMQEGEDIQFLEHQEALREAERIITPLREKRNRNRPDITIRVHSPNPEIPPVELTDDEETDQPPRFWKLLWKCWPTIPQKPVLILGLLICLASGSITPIFSFLLSRLLFAVSTGARDVSTINMFGGIVLSVAALDGILLGLKYYILESVGMLWATRLRTTAYNKVLQQDKSWFDSPNNPPVRLVQVIVKDGDDSRTLVSSVIGQCLVVCAMLSTGLVWAMVRGWELTFAGLGIAPVFVVVMSIQSKLVGKCEVRNKRAREAVARDWYDLLCNIKGIRAMGIGKPFLDSFESSVKEALSTGMRGAWVEGGTYGVASGLIYGAEAVLFYVGAVLVARGRYSYLQMIETLNLIVFSVSIGSQLMAFTQKIAKTVQATHDLMTLTDLSTRTSESQGILKPPPSILASGPVSFKDVSFAYPSRPSVLNLKDFNLHIGQSECIALVGASGSGKTTITSLLQRLYEPLEGTIRFGNIDVSQVDTQCLRNGLGIVSQAPQLFPDVSVEENILYGVPPEAISNKTQTDELVLRAATWANIDWLNTAEGGLKSTLGEVSGGQAQRIQIARALARPGIHLLILDECTSALDTENQSQVLEAIVNVRRRAAEEGRALKMVIVTHKTEVMQICDRVVVLKDGKVCEEGPYEDLVEKRGGVFRELARGGIWEA